MSEMASFTQLRTAPEVFREQLESPPEMQWFLLSARIGSDIGLKHENHTLSGTLKIGGGPSDLERFTKGHAKAPNIIYLTPRNQARSLAFASVRQNVSSIISVLHFNKSGTSLTFAVLLSDSLRRTSQKVLLASLRGNEGAELFKPSLEVK